MGQLVPVFEEAELSHEVGQIFEVGFVSAEAVFLFCLIGRRFVILGVGQQPEEVHFEEPLGAEVESVTLEGPEVIAACLLIQFDSYFDETVEDVEKVAIPEHFSVLAFALDGFLQSVVVIPRVAVHQDRTRAKVIL